VTTPISSALAEAGLTDGGAACQGVGAWTFTLCNTRCFTGARPLQPRPRAVPSLVLDTCRPSLRH
jgi:hypothetical protein